MVINTSTNTCKKNRIKQKLYFLFDFSQIIYYYIFNLLTLWFYSINFNGFFLKISKKLLYIIIIRINYQFLLEFFNLNSFEKFNILFFIILFLFFIIKFLYQNFKNEIQLYYFKFIIFYFQKIWKIIFILFFIILYLFLNYYLFGFIECSGDINKKKLFSIGGGILVAGGLSYLYFKPIVSKVIINSQTALFTTLQENNTNIYTMYKNLYTNRIIKCDVAINNHFLYKYNPYNLTSDEKIDLVQPLFQYRLDLKEYCEGEIAGIFKTPALMCDIKRVDILIAIQRGILESMNNYNNNYSRLIQRLQEANYNTYSLTPTERFDLGELITAGSKINDSFDFYILNLLDAGDSALSTALGVEGISTSLLYHRDIIPIAETQLYPIFHGNNNILKLNQNNINYENIFFNDNPFFYDVCLICMYGFFSIAHLYTSGGNPIPTDYFVGSCTRLFSFKKNKINRYESHEETVFLKLNFWYDV
jgi:hypothetical protein